MALARAAIHARAAVLRGAWTARRTGLHFVPQLANAGLITARTLGVQVPPSVLQRTDRVSE